MPRQPIIANLARNAFNAVTGCVAGGIDRVCIAILSPLVPDDTADNDTPHGEVSEVPQDAHDLFSRPVQNIPGAHLN